MPSLQEAIIISADLSEIPNRVSSCLMQDKFSTPISLQAGVTRLVLLEGVEVFVRDGKHEEDVIVGVQSVDTRAVLANSESQGYLWPVPV